MSTLLDALASVPPELLVEGTRLDVTSADGQSWSFVLGEPVPPSPPRRMFEVPMEFAALPRTEVSVDGGPWMERPDQLPTLDDIPNDGAPHDVRFRRVDEDGLSTAISTLRFQRDERPPAAE